MGLPVNKEAMRFEDFDKLVEFCLEWEERRHDLDYEVDGMVIKVDDFQQREELGEAAGPSGIRDIAQKPDPEAARQIGTAAEELLLHPVSHGMWLSVGVTPFGDSLDQLLRYWLGARPAAEPPDGPRYPLHRPDLERLTDDLSLTEAIESRRSNIDFSPRPVSARAIGELLFRVARIRWTRLTRTGDGIEYVVSDRPYPSTADLYELELYISLDRCPELPRGTFHYDPGAHSLTLVDDSEPALAELLDTAKVAAGCDLRPAVLITMTSRIARLSWMYGTIAYSLTLKHVGELQQTFLLVATAMGLACQAPAIVDGTADEALRLDWPNEVSVGEFLVGFEQ